MYNTMGLFDGLTSLFEGKSEVEKAQKKFDDITGKCKVDTEVADKALKDAKLKQVPADAAKVEADAAKVAADKAAADAKLVADKAAVEKAAADAKVADAKAVVDLKGGKSKRVRFSKKIKGGKNKKRVRTNKKRR